MNFNKYIAGIGAACALGIGTAAAENFQVYGLVDYGINYQYVDPDTNVGGKGTIAINSGMNSGSRIGIKGSEDLGNGTNIGFVLENGFNSDDGTMGNDDRLFGREAQLYIANDQYGTIGFGRVGQLASTNGSYGVLGVVSPFSDGWGDTIGVKHITANGWGRVDNAITYVSPSINGVKFHFQYSFKNDNNEDGNEGHSSADRYYAGAVTYDVGNMQLVGVIDSTNYSSETHHSNPSKDQVTVSFGGNYDFGELQAFGFGQYFTNAKYVGNSSVTTNSEIGDGYSFAGRRYDGADGFGLGAGLNADLYGGNAKMTIGYMHAQANKDSDMEINRLNVAVGYDYNLSKRTMVYTAASYNWDNVSGEYRNTNNDVDPMSYELLAGIVHKF